MAKIYDFNFDRKVKQFQYLPYISGIQKDLVDKYNKFILKRKFGYYRDEQRSINYDKKNKRYINDSDKYLILRNNLTKISLLYKDIYDQFMIAKINNDNKIYDQYMTMTLVNLQDEIKRLNIIINNYQKYKVKKGNIIYINHLFYLIIFLFILAIFLYLK